MARGGLSVKEAKAAAARLLAWLCEDGQNWGQHETDIDLVLRWLDATQPKARNGRSVSRKGYVFENESVKFLRAGGLECSRVPLSGAGEEKGDIRMKCGWGQTLKGEAKRRGKLADWIVDALGEHDFLIMRQDRGDTLVMVRLALFRDLCQ